MPDGTRVVVTGLPELRRALRIMTPATDKHFRKRLKNVANVVQADARGRASWSHRIPGAIGSGVLAKGPYVRVSANKAPHGPLYEEGSGRGGSWRHPLFGDRSHWYTQRTRPFLRPAVEGKGSYIEAEAIAAVEQAKVEAEL